MWWRSANALPSEWDSWPPPSPPHTPTQTNPISKVPTYSHLSARAASRRSLEQVHNVQTKCLMRSPLKVTREGGDDVTNELTVQQRLKILACASLSENQWDISCRVENRRLTAGMLPSWISYKLLSPVLFMCLAHNNLCHCYWMISLYVDFDLHNMTVTQGFPMGISNTCCLYCQLKGQSVTCRPHILDSSRGFEVCVLG